MGIAAAGPRRARRYVPPCPAGHARRILRRFRRACANNAARLFGRRLRVAARCERELEIRSFESTATAGVQ